jgi:hypothetical protein
VISGEAFAVPTSRTPDEVLEAAIGRLLQAAPGMRLRSIAMRPDCRLDVAQLWAVLQIHRNAQVFGRARLSDIGDQFRLPYEVIQPAFDRLVHDGYATREVDDLWLTPSGVREVDFITTLIREWIVDKLTRSPTFEGRPDRAQVQAALDRVAHRIVAQRDWREDRRDLANAETERIRVAVSAGGVPSRHEPNRNIR